MSRAAWVGRARISALVALAAVALLGGCWADFPESRYRLDARVTPDLVGPDLVNPDLAPGDLGVDQARPDLGESDVGPPTEAGADQALDLPGADQQVDTSTDTTPADLTPPDTFACTPNAFIGCSGKTLQRCNASGDGLVNTNCGSASCSVALQRCDQCDPAQAATCQGKQLRSCEVTGLFTLTPCPLGCLAGVCCTDGDGDGAACDDCDDSDGDVFPAQQQYFDVPRTSGGYDYNCDSSEEQELPDLVNCQGSGANCGGDGWVGQVPACGATGQYATCVKSGGACTQQPPTSQKQACR